MISHAFSNVVADAVGTLTHWLGATTATVAASDMVLPSHWNSAHDGASTFAGNTLGASTWSGTNLLLAAVSNLSLSLAGNTLSIVGPDLAPYLTTAQAPGAYLTTAALSNHSHGNPTLALTNLTGTTASNSAGLTLSLSGPSVAAFLTTAALSNHNHDAAYASINHSHGNPTLALTNLTGTTASASNGLTISLSGPSVAAFLTTAALSNHSHGNPTLALTNLSGTTASNSAGLTLSLSAAAPGGGAGNTISYYENFPGLTNLADIIPGQSSSFVQPFVLPGAISADYLRLFLTMATNSTSFATTANTTFSCRRASTWNAVVYVQGTGLSSASLQSYASGSAGMTQSVNLAANANGSQYTVTIGMTYPMTGGTSSYSTSYATSQTRFDLSSESMTLFTGNLRALDIAFGNALPQSNYWLMVGRNSTVTTQGTAIMSQLLVSEQLKAYSQFNTQLRMMGQLSNATVQLRPGVGSFSTNAIGTTESLGLSNITFQNGNVFPFFQLIRHA